MSDIRDENDIDEVEMDYEKGDDEVIKVDKSQKSKKETASRSPYWKHFVKAIIKVDRKQHGTKGIKNHYESLKTSLIRLQLIKHGFLFSATVDNTSSNDCVIAYLKKKFDNWGISLWGEKYVHMRCIAHIINLVVQDGLKNIEENEAISWIRGAIRYIRNSTTRYKRFEKCAELEKLETKKLLCLNVPIRWNFAYLMLESTIRHRRAFIAYMDVDLAYAQYLSKVPYDGFRVRMIGKLLNCCASLAYFFTLTLSVSGLLYVTTNLIFHEISIVDMLLTKWLKSKIMELKKTLERMKDKFDKYWGVIEKINGIIYCAIILDPQHKIEFLEFSFNKLCSNGGKAKSITMQETIKYGMQELFNKYKMKYGGSSSPIASLNSTTSTSSSFDSKAYLKEQFKKKKKGKVIT